MIQKGEALGPRIIKDRYENASASSGTRQDCDAIEDAVGGSQALRSSLIHLFWRFEDQHGLEPGEARILLLDTGVSIS